MPKYLSKAARSAAIVDHKSFMAIGITLTPVVIVSISACMAKSVFGVQENLHVE